MISNIPEAIATLLQQLHGHRYFMPSAGPLRMRLLEAVAETFEGDAGERLKDPDLVLEVSIGRQDAEEEIVVGVKLTLSGQPHAAELALAALSTPELEDLSGYLTGLLDTGTPAEPAPADKVAVRKRVEGDYHEQAAASARLKVSSQWLKSVVPCTDYSYDEIDGKKFIREYFWSKELIERLFKIKCSKTTPEDLQYVASECCEGDLEWAKDLIARLKSPNRVEQAPRDQVQKNQGQAKQGQLKQGQGQGQGQQQGQGERQGQGQGQGQQQGQGERQGQGQGQGQQQGQGERQGQGQQGQGGERQGERPRSRSRHKRSFRDKDGRKPQPGAPGPKPPASSN